MSEWLKEHAWKSALFTRADRNPKLADIGLKVHMIGRSAIQAL